MGDLSKFLIGGETANIKDASARNNIGDLSSLATTAKNNLVSAINEVNNKPDQGNVLTYDGTTESITVS